jgi:hypothetical protein
MAVPVRETRKGSDNSCGKNEAKIRLSSSKKIKSLNINNLNINIHMRAAKNELLAERSKSPAVRPPLVHGEEPRRSGEQVKQGQSGVSFKKQSCHVNLEVNSKKSDPNLRQKTPSISKRDPRPGLGSEISKLIKKNRQFEANSQRNLPTSADGLYGKGSIPASLFFKTSMERNVSRNTAKKISAKNSAEKMPPKSDKTFQFSLRAAHSDGRLASILRNRLGVGPSAGVLRSDLRKAKLGSLRAPLESFQSVPKNVLNKSKGAYSKPASRGSLEHSMFMRNLEAISRTGSFNLNIFHTLQTMINGRNTNKFPSNINVRKSLKSSFADRKVGQSQSKWQANDQTVPHREAERIASREASRSIGRTPLDQSKRAVAEFVASKRGKTQRK